MYQEIEFLIKCDEAYHNGEESLISDYEYDILKSEARSLYPNHPYFQTVGATPKSDKVDLPYTLGSLEKKKYDGSLNQWIIDNDVEEIVIGDKLDGCTILVKYLNGEVDEAYTRGDGYVGRDITEKAKIFCPKCEWEGVFFVKGEVLARADVARNLGYKKSRTFVAGQLNADEPEHLDKLEVVFYHILNEDLRLYEMYLENLESLGLPYVHHEIYTVRDFYSSMEEILSDYYRNRRQNSVYDIDGLVITDNKNGAHENDYYPSNSVAFKVNEDAVQTTVKSVEWEIKRSGKLMPVVHIEPVDISGSTVSKATGFNYGFIRDNGICEGAEIGIVLSGEIIPYITDVYREAENCVHPTHCPSCGAKLGISASNVDLLCFNPDCEGKMLYQLENFLLANGSEEVTAVTLRKIGVKSFEELLDLDEFDISTIEGFGASRASTIINQIQKVYNTTPANLLKSFGINGIGKSVSASIVHHFENFGDIFEASEDDFMVIEGIGRVLAETLVRELPYYLPLYNLLSERGLRFAEKVSDVLKGKKITLTGKSEIKRNDLIKAIEAHGGMVKGISKGVDMLFTNSPNSTTSKMKKAQEYGIEINTYDKLYELLGMSV